MDQAGTPALREAIRHMHDCDAVFVEWVVAHDVHEGQVAWEREVGVFSLVGHPKASRAYAWSEPGKGMARRGWSAGTRLSGVTRLSIVTCCLSVPRTPTSVRGNRSWPGRPVDPPPRLSQQPARPPCPVAPGERRGPPGGGAVPPRPDEASRHGRRGRAFPQPSSSPT